MKTECGGRTLALQLRGLPSMSRLPWAVADGPKVIAHHAPYDGWLACLVRSLARHIAVANCGPSGDREFLTEVAGLAVLLPRSVPRPRVATLHEGSLSRAQNVLEFKGLSPGRSALFRGGFYTAGRRGAPLLGFPALQGLTGRSCCGFRR